MRLFHKAGDYEAFERVLAEGLERYPVDLLTYCLMPNHWHLVVRPGKRRRAGTLLGWVGVTHVRRHHEHYHRRGGGHLYQGRFKSFPVAEDDYFLTLCRYVEANPLRAELVDRAEEWRWSGLWMRIKPARACRWRRGPCSGRGIGWRGQWGSEGGAIGDVADCVQRGRPWGTAVGADHGQRLGLEFTLRGPGRRGTTENQ